ncbi:MAG: DNA mismatch repair endonuclease MutL [Paludibacteraceae bacterium]|nr:DNA mismatch repair endonuclease MutL [Paludibacteraceae bacterium]
MDDIIHLLPDTVADQIAAGEVVQQPSSVIKELVENSIDAGATEIRVIVKDAGRTLIQVVDNGKGMSEQDAAVAFQRHATSKIRSVEDLSVLCTMGFRGEALASIAAVGHVELRTRREVDELGTQVLISGGTIEAINKVSCPVGANFAVRDLFYNVPARRKFLKSDNVEFGNIERDFIRIALVYPDVFFELYHNDKLCYSLNKSNIRERIGKIFDSKLNSKLLSISADTTYGKISGYVGTPETAIKRNKKQYFFVNGRYMEHPYFRKAVTSAYDRLLHDGTSPSFFIYFDVDPHQIDVNVHPTKTEIKFADEQDLYKVLTAVVRESLGKSNIFPTMEFDINVNDAYVPGFEQASTEIPDLNIDMEFDPFQAFGSSSTPSKPHSVGGSSGGGSSYRPFNPNPNESTFGNIYDYFENAAPEIPTGGNAIDYHDIPSTLDIKEGHSINNGYNGSLLQSTDLHPEVKNCFQIAGRYIVASSGDNLMYIDQRRAHIRVLYEKFMAELKDSPIPSQKVMFRQTLELSAAQAATVEDIMPQLNNLGYDLQLITRDVYEIRGVPADKTNEDNVASLLEIITSISEGEIEEDFMMNDKVAQSMAESQAIRYGKEMSAVEIKHLCEALFECENYNYTPDCKPIITSMSAEEIKKRLN